MPRAILIVNFEQLLYMYNSKSQENVVRRAAKPPVLRRVPAVSRAIAILRFLAKAKEPIGVVPLARAVELIPSTCLHIVRILSDEGLVAFNPETKRYTLGAGVLSLARAFSLRNPFVHVVRPHLEDLSRKHGCAAAAVEESGPDHYIVVGVGDVHAGLSVRLSVGTRFPALISATGRCVAAFSDQPMAPAELRKRFAKLRWENPPKFEDWLADIERARQVGYAIDEGNYIRGVSIIAVPVFNDTNLMLGCIAATGLREQFVGKRLTSLIESVSAVAREVNRELGHDGSIHPARSRQTEKAPVRPD
jgi:DNA-binding IclR family transcriptional regulator